MLNVIPHNDNDFQNMMKIAPAPLSNNNQCTKNRFYMRPVSPSLVVKDSPFDDTAMHWLVKFIYLLLFFQI